MAREPGDSCTGIRIGFHEESAGAQRGREGGERKEEVVAERFCIAEARCKLPRKAEGGDGLDEAGRGINTICNKTTARWT